MLGKRTLIAHKDKNEFNEKSGLIVRGLRKAFGKSEVLSFVDFAIDKGECIALVGPNGSGKTTLLNILCGFHKADGGTIWWAGKKLLGQSPDVIARLGISRTFQQPRVFIGLTVSEHLELAANGLYAYGFSNIFSQLKKKKRNVKVMNTIGKWFFTIWGKEFLSMPVEQLSYGQQKGLNIACALVRRPNLLLLDEPFSGMDRAVRKQIMKWLYKKDGIASSATIIFVEHEAEEREAPRDRTFFLCDGKIVYR